MITVRGGLKAILRRFVRMTGYDLVSFKDGGLPPDFEPLHREIIDAVARYTMTSPERLFGLIEAVRYTVRHGLPGAMLECGVYKGGSMMAVALTLLREGVNDRDLYLFDTFEGMPPPSSEDVDLHGNSQVDEFEGRRAKGRDAEWLACSQERVREALLSTGYPAERIHLVAGTVEETLPRAAPERIALLRLDTDWYSSTKHELEHLFPRLVERGVLIVDDYGHFQGARKAVDEYLAKLDTPALLTRLDYTGRMLVKA